jgi:tetratricopeptide (TPR) repeat protein
MQSAAELIDEGRRARAAGNREAARACYAEAAAQYRREGLTLAWAHTIRHVADLWLEDAQFADAQPLYEEALEAYRGSLETRILDLANTLRPYALLMEAMGNPGAAGKLWREAQNLYASIRVEAGVAECESHLAAHGRKSAS